MIDRIADRAEKVRLDNLRLECLKLAHDGDDASIVLAEGKTPTAHYIDAAREMFDYVTDAPERPELFAVKRMDEAEPGDHPSLGPLNYLAFYGSAMRWDHEYCAYRFRTKREAETAILKYEAELGGVMLPVPLPAYMDLF